MGATEHFYQDLESERTQTVVSNNYMSDLIEALDRILNWLRRQNREHPEATQGWWLRSPEEENNAPLVKPGLSSAEIEEISKDLRLQLPPELCELYQWSNGTQYDNSLYEFDWLFDAGQGWGFFMGFGVYPFQLAVSESLRWNQGRKLTIFIGRECRDGYLVFDKNSQLFPVIFRDFKGGGNDTLIKYASLTNMMMTIADCYEQAYYINSNRYFSKDESKALEIWQKYNAEQIVSATLNQIEQVELRLPELDINTGLSYIQDVGDTLRFSHDEKLIAPLIRVLKRPQTNTAYEENLDYLRQMSSLYLGLAGGTNAVEPLIDALKEEYWLTRYWATITLGNLKDSRAVSSLIELLQDSQEMIRQAAQEALSKISNPISETSPIYSNPAIANLEASAALYGMTLEDILYPNMENLRKKLNSDTPIDKNRDLSPNDDNSDDIPF